MDLDNIEKIINSHVKKYKLRMKNSSNNSTEVTYEIQLKGKEDNEIINSLKEKENIISVNIVSYNGEIAG